MARGLLNAALCLLLATVPGTAHGEGQGVAEAIGACAEIDGIEQVMRKGVVLVLGELHGTQESPALGGEIICHAAAAKMSVTLALELLDTEGAGIDAYLASERTASDRAQLTGAGAWSAEYQDGRTSGAVLDLLDRLASLRAGGASIAVELFDRSGWRSGQERDRLMAEALAGIVGSSPSDLVIVLTGNIHSRVSRGTRWDESYEPMIYLASATIKKELLTLDLAHTGGTAWICIGSEPSSCGVRQLGGQSEVDHLMIEFGTDPETTGHHGRYHVGALNASLPAAGSF